jgi:hypothetical protein
LLSWKDTAQKLSKLAAVQDLAQQQKYESAWSVAGSLTDSFADRRFWPDKDSILCIDDKNTIQGCLTLGRSFCIPDYLEIELLMTNPLNIESSLTRGLKTVHGVGRACVLQAIRRCLAKNLSGLAVFPRDSAIGFYQHMGFTVNNVKLGTLDFA